MVTKAGSSTPAISLTLSQSAAPNFSVTIAWIAWLTIPYMEGS